ncbi:spore coat polysaccharide biosynthesis protein SpsF [Rhodothalassium salexigens DSM 2132]|uniref:Spore coat polysaccharide biosynthesis protein SpsF n=1 Tax=Rhodothalassium salexigens DSM 2132 TaxID=1188247 RepID=A0A4R2P5S5_RHOSA|nr:NTP transferase domain-containing protein [Rhodothalassium salexigens]MBB4212735.1 spore coat polysaccharide biosynthesis protein SpsF (cytidylyltransferase family) [Rhodothalassium salexigens DSM 2132]MBK1639238.1 hypothetical protein [Rhodothalassium salexigens DSM 2132]TCP30162.1 spore coat polysaccharide biosynthesis protein SpsF [Rhodothalassium salexigens DSM 2132]
MADRLVCIIQARLNSSRLPGKVLKPLGGQPVLAHVINRCRAIGGVQSVVVAAVDAADEQPVADLAQTLGVPVVRGPEHDVLSRYHMAAEAQSADHVMRVTADCPVLDPALVTELVAHYHDRRPDHACLAHWPHGMNAEIFSRALLDTMHATATAPGDREHVTLWVTRQGDRRRLVLCPATEARLDHRYRLTLDYEDDYRVLTRLASLMGPSFTTATCAEFMAMLDADPALTAINQAAGDDWRARDRVIRRAPEGDPASPPPASVEVVRTSSGLPRATPESPLSAVR